MTADSAPTHLSDGGDGSTDEVVTSPPSGVRAAAAGWGAGRVLALGVAAAVAVVVVRLLLVQSFVIPSSSMAPLLQVGDRVAVSRLDRLAGQVERGDVIVFDGDGVFDTPRTPPRNSLAAAGRTLAAALGAPVGETDYVKRVIGLPGDRVTCCDGTGRLTVNGVPLVEPYLAGAGPASRESFDIVVPPGRYWVMGDNRDDSGDSRAHLGDPGGGTVPADHIIGRVAAVWWPWGRAAGVARVQP